MHSIIAKAKKFERNETKKDVQKQCNIGEVNRMEGLYEEAKTQYNKALTIYKAKRGEESSEVGCVYNNLGLVADEEEDYEAVN